MNKPTNPFTVHYIQTPRRIESPVKIDAILQQRMKAFLASRKSRS